MRAVFCFVVVVVAASGCSHVQAELPGVLDLRSDGRDAPVAADRVADTGRDGGRDADASRDGLMGFFAGPGTQGRSDVTIVDRNSLVAIGPLVLMSVLNSSSTAEWNAALQGGALRDVTVGETVSLGAIGASLVKGICLCPAVGGWVSPTIDITGSGTRVDVGPAFSAPVPPERDTPIPPALPADGGAPLTTTPAPGAESPNTLTY